MRNRWILVIAVVVSTTALGFQPAEPLAELRKFGSVSPAAVWVDGQLHGLCFVAECGSATHFSEAMKVLRRCPSVNRIYIQKMKNLREALLEVTSIDHIAAVELQRTEVDERDLTALTGMKNLQFLDLSHNPTVNDASVAVLSGLKGLRYLDLTNTKVTGTGLKDRADMVSLYQLTLNDCPVTDDSLAAIPRFPKLEELLLGRTRVTDKGLMTLVGWHSLRRVTRTALTTKGGSQAFNDSFLAARRKAREAGVAMDPRDIPPVFLDSWRE